MITGQYIADTAESGGLLGTPYSKLDCQAFVEEVLKLAGLHIINYRGSNHMWRDLVHSRAKVSGHAPPPGSLAFIVRNDGGEVKRGYHDDMGNATHVAIVINSGTVMESTTGGVQYGKLSRFTDYGLICDVDYTGKGSSDDAGEGSTGTPLEQMLALIDAIKQASERLEAIADDLYRSSRTN